MEQDDEWLTTRSGLWRRGRVSGSVKRDCGRREIVPGETERRGPRPVVLLAYRRLTRSTCRYTRRGAPMMTPRQKRSDCVARIAASIAGLRAVLAWYERRPSGGTRTDTESAGTGGVLWLQCRSGGRPLPPDAGLSDSVRDFRAYWRARERSLPDYVTGRPTGHSTRGDRRGMIYPASGALAALTPERPASVGIDWVETHG